MTAQWISSVALAIAGIMLSAGFAHALGHRALARSIDAYRLLPQGAGNYLAIPLGLAECLAGVLLLMPSTRYPGACVAAVLLSVFTLAMALAVARGNTGFDCGCAGAHALRPGAGLLVRNALLLCAIPAVTIAPAVSPGAWQCAGALGLLLCWHITNGMIAAAQWPQDD